MSADLLEAGPLLADPARLWFREECGSTNDEARALGEAGVGSGAVIVAQRQTAGRGRRGAAWIAPEGEALAFSVLLRPQAPRGTWSRLALAAGLAVADAIEELGLTARIKWPNDVWIAGRKVCGILVEAGDAFAIVGIGINVNVQAFPESLAASATSLRLERGTPVARGAFLAAVVNRLLQRAADIGGNFESVRAAVETRCALRGMAVSLETPEGTLTGIARGIGAGGELLINDGHGTRAVVQAHEVRLL